MTQTTDSTNPKSVTITSITNRWLDPASRPLFKGKLIDKNGYKCAQGDVLSCAGWTDEQLRNLLQFQADQEVAKILGISIIHSILLRNINDKKEGAPQDVLLKPENILGINADLILGLWLTDTAAANAAYAAYAAAAANAAYAAYAAAAANAAAYAAAAANAAYAAYAAAAADAAAYAAAADTKLIYYCTLELIGMAELIRKARQPYFLAFLGFDTWDKVKTLSTLYPRREKAKF